MIFLELHVISNSRVRSIGDALYILWNVNFTNKLSTVHFQVEYCPLNIYLERQRCKEVNITLCNAFYQSLPSISGSVSTSQDELADYIKVGDSMVFSRNISARVSGKWNRTSAEFVCAVHNIDECRMAYGGPLPGSTYSDAAVKGEILITATTVHGRERKLLDIKQNLGLLPCLLRRLQSSSNYISVYIFLQSQISYTLFRRRALLIDEFFCGRFLSFPIDT